MTETAIGISIGTRFIGLAIIRDGVLIDDRIRIFLEEWSDTKLEKILKYLETYIQNHTASSIAIKHNHISRTSVGLAQATKGIMALAVNLNLPCQSFTIDELKYYCNGASTKYELMQYVFQKYPEVEKNVRLSNSNFNYVMKTIEAVALAHAIS